MKPTNPMLRDVLKDPACLTSCCFCEVATTVINYRGLRVVVFAAAHDFEIVYALGVMPPRKAPQRGLFFQMRLNTPGARWERGFWERYPNSWQNISARYFCSQLSQRILTAMHVAWHQHKIR